ncbi:hypothetical protein [Chromobacterium sp. CV08]|uniref:hypothetical protein n=1 Tax=Chromobacterium sp. CV08 TaxID=3133274 RepID=UPI003DAA1AB8
MIRDFHRVSRETNYTVAHLFWQGFFKKFCGQSQNRRAPARCPPRSGIRIETAAHQIPPETSSEKNSASNNAVAPRSEMQPKKLATIKPLIPMNSATAALPSPITRAGLIAAIKVDEWENNPKKLILKIIFSIWPYTAPTDDPASTIKSR